MEQVPEEVSDNDSDTAGPNADQSDDQEEGNWTNQAEGEAVYQNSNEIADQAAEGLSYQDDPDIYGQPEGRTHQQIQADSDLTDTAGYSASGKVSQTMSGFNISSQIDNVQYEHDLKMSGQADQITSEQTDHRLSNEAHQRPYEKTDHIFSAAPAKRSSEKTDTRLSTTVSDGRTSEKIDHRLSGPADQRTSGQIDRRVSGPADRKTSGQIDHRLTGLADQRISLQTDHRLSSRTDQRISEQVDHILSHPVDQRISVQNHQATEPAQHEDDYDESDHIESILDYQANRLVHKQENHTEDYLTDYGAPSQYDYRMFTQVEDRKKDEEDDYRVQPCKFEDSQKDLNNFGFLIAVGAETQTSTFLQNYKPFDTRLTSDFQTKDQDLSQIFPSVPPKLDYTLGEETKPDYVSQFEQEKSFYEHKQTYKKFPSIVYEDPYQLALQYMEKHSILQIFQITEDLVCEKPEDPLHFMLCQVQKMMKNREEM